MIDPRYLIDYLRTEDVVADAVGDFTAGTATYIPIVGEIRDPLWKNMPRRAIVVTSAGGPEPPGRNNDLAFGRQDVFCYGKDIGDAWALHGIVYEHLRYGGQRTMGGKVVVNIRPTAGGIQQRDPDTDWPFVWMEYTMALSEGR